MPDPLPADELLARSLRVYAELDGYSDHGELTTRTESSHPEQPTHTTRKRFATRWKRPDRLRFQFREVAVGPEEEWVEYAIWAGPDGAWSWWTIRPSVTRARDLDAALGAAAGVSGGLSMFVPSLVRGRALETGMPTEPAGFSGENMLLDDAPCLCISMQCGEMRQRIWIETASALILRVDEQNSLSKEQSNRLHRRTLERLNSSEVRDALDADQVAQMRETTLEMLSRPITYDLTFTRSARYFPVINPDLDDSEFLFLPRGA